MARDSGQSAGSRVIIENFLATGVLPVASPYPQCGKIWGGSRPVRGGQACLQTVSRR